MEKQNITIVLPVDAWNVVMNALSQRPYVEVVGLVAEMKKQADEQMGQSAEPVNTEVAV